STDRTGGGGLGGSRVRPPRPGSGLPRGLGLRDRHERGHDRCGPLCRGPGNGRGRQFRSLRARCLVESRRRRDCPSDNLAGASLGAGRMMQVVLASNNGGKLREFSAILSAAGIEMLSQATLNVTEAEEPYGTFVENALAKARHASQQTGLPALADDSGLCVAALGGAPGVHSARYASQDGGARSDAANNAKLVADMAVHSDRRATYVA